MEMNKTSYKTAWKMYGERYGDTDFVAFVNSLIR